MSCALSQRVNLHLLIDYGLRSCLFQIKTITDRGSYCPLEHLSIYIQNQRNTQIVETTIGSCLLSTIALYYPATYVLWNMNTYESPVTEIIQTRKVTRNSNEIQYIASDPKFQRNSKEHSVGAYEECRSKIDQVHEFLLGLLSSLPSDIMCYLGIHSHRRDTLTSRWLRAREHTRLSSE